MNGLPTTLAPWLSVHGSARALEFYKAAFGAIEVYLLDVGDGGIVARLAIAGPDSPTAEFWIAEESPDPGKSASPASGRSAECPPVRLILTVPDPDAVFATAIAAGATEVYPVSEQHGWRVGRLTDPFGHHWEIGCPVK